MKLSELRGKSREELLQELEGFKRELLNLRVQWQA
ncbi:MAG: 50S ribosomal protein L29, partial [Planctomycetes bacterium RIFCSPHIGHO2_12_FULL_52_36]